MKGRLRMTLKPSKSAHEIARENAKMFFERLDLGAEHFIHRRNGGLESQSAVLSARHVNDLAERLVYLFDNPDASLSITPDGPILNACDDGHDHEVMFKLGRERA